VRSCQKTQPERDSPVTDTLCPGSVPDSHPPQRQPALEAAVPALALPTGRHRRGDPPAPSPETVPPLSATHGSLLCPNGYKCEDEEACIMATERCDGYLDCSDSSDERNCTGKQQPGPVSHALICASTRNCSPEHVAVHSQRPRRICLSSVAQVTPSPIYNQLGQTSRPVSTLAICPPAASDTNTTTLGRVGEKLSTLRGPRSLALPSSAE